MIIGLTGKMKAGKTTLAWLICKYYGYEKMSFADPLKDSLAAMFGWDRTRLDDFDYKQERDFITGKTRREILQMTATDFIRDKMDPDFWVKRMTIALKKHFERSDNLIVIDDIRFTNEADLVLRLGGTILRIQRPGVDIQDKHKSEIPIPYQDYVICNDGEKEKMLDPYIHSLGILNTIKDCKENVRFLLEQEIHRIWLKLQVP